jgi:hypothetical protein
MIRHILILIAVLLIIEYYSFIALKTVIRHLNQGMQSALLIIYVVLTLAVLVSIYAFLHWHSNWPSTIMKLTVNIFIGIFLGKVLVAAVMLIGDMILAFKWIFSYLGSITAGRSKMPAEVTPLISRSRFISQTALLLGAVLSSGWAYGMTNRYRYKIRRVSLFLENLPKGFKGIKIAQISDIHSGSFDDADAVSAGVDAIMREKPDLILFTGDLVNDRANEITPYLDVFRRLKAPLGVYSILGNHDYGDYVNWESDEAKKKNLEQLKLYHADLGWRLLMNEHVILQRNQEQVALVGVENWGAKAFTKYGNLREAMTGLENSGIPLKILMSHDPSHWDAEVRKDFPDIALTLSGHTHGMQFGIEIPGFKWSPVQYMYKQWAGLYQEGSQYLYVNRGFGFIGYQGRLGILPEISMIELV